MKPIIWISITVTILILLVGGGYLFGGTLISILGGETCVFERGSTSSGIYNCNSEDGCYVWIQQRLCSKKTEEAKVIFRQGYPVGETPSTSNENSWIAVSIGENLVGFKLDSAGVGSSGGPSNMNYICDDPNNKGVYEHDGKIYIYQGFGISHKYWVFKDFSSVADKTPTPKEPYTSNNQEILSSTSMSLYYCKDSYDVNGNTKYLEYSEDVAGYYGLDESDAVKLNYGESIELGFSGVIEYKEKICTKCECTKNVCVGTGYRKCENIDSTTGCGTLSDTTYECTRTNEICVDGECKIPYFISFETRDQTGILKSTFSPTEDVIGRLYISSELDKTITAYFDLYKDGVFKKTVSETIRLPMLPGDYEDVNFGKLDYGNYDVRIRIEDYEKEFSFTVSDELIVYSNFIGKTKFTTGKDIVIRIDVFDSSGELRLDIPSHQSNIKVDATLDAFRVNYESKEVRIGEYEYTFNFDKIGMFKVEFEINKPGYPPFTIGNSHYIGRSGLIIRTLFGEADTTGEYQLNFNVVDEEGTKISTDTITATMTASRTAVTETIPSRDISGREGEYSIRYNFKSEDTYKLKIFVQKEGFVSDTSETIIDIINKEGYCGDGTCSLREDEVSCPEDCKKKPFPWSTILLIGLPILIVGGFVWSVMRKRK